MKFSPRFAGTGPHCQVCHRFYKVGQVGLMSASIIWCAMSCSIHCIYMHRQHVHAIYSRLPFTQESHLLDNLSIPYTAVRVVAVYLVGYGVSVTFDVSLNETKLDEPGMISTVDAVLSTLSTSNLSIYSVLQQGQGHEIVIPAGEGHANSIYIP